MAERPRLAQQKQFQRPHVLIVCDDPSLSEFLSEGLPLGGFWTSVIASGLQVIEVFRLRQFDMIVVDAELTSFAWLELVRRLRGRSDRATPGLVRTIAPVVIVSESALALDDRAREELGIVEVLTAPLELDDVVRTLHARFGEWQEAHPDVPLADLSPDNRE
jgi:two-component system OmpR family response regulator